MEWLAFDHQVYSLVVQIVALVGGEILQVLAPICDNLPISPREISSWPHGYDDEMISTQIVAIEAAVGTNWTDAVKEPVHKNPKNITEAMSTNYDKDTKTDSREINVSNEIEAFVQGPGGLLTLNTNKMILDYQGYPMDAFLNKRNFRRIRCWLNGRLALYVFGERHFILVHHPFCLASDPQSHVTDE